MSISFLCQRCRTQLKTPDGSTGKHCRCPSCGEIMTVPDPSIQPRLQDAPVDLPLDLSIGVDENSSRNRSLPPSGRTASSHSHTLSANVPPIPTQHQRTPQIKNFNQPNFSQQPGGQQRNPFAAPATDYTKPSEPYYGARNTDRGAMLLTFGILSVVMALMSCGCYGMFTPIGLGFGIAGWYMSAKDFVKLNSGQINQVGSGLIQAGYTLGIIGTVLNCLIILLFGGVIAFYLLALVIL